MRKLIILFMLLITVAWMQAQVQLTSIKKSESKFKIPIAQRELAGQTGYFQEYGDLLVLMDSLGIVIETVDSLVYNQTTDSLSLYTSEGVYKTLIPGSTGGITSLNGQTGSSQTFATSTASTGFNINSSSNVHTFNLPYQETSTNLSLGQNSELMTNGVAIGQNAGDPDCNNCFALGKDVLQGAITGASNDVGIGLQALYAITDGVDNFGLGNYAGSNITTGDYNVCIGTQAGQTMTTPSNNIFIGRGAGRVATGGNNTMVGTTSGWNSNVSGCVYIGNETGFSNSTNNLGFIDNSSTSTPVLGMDFSANRMTVNKVPSSGIADLHVGGTFAVDTRTGTAATVGGWTSTGVATAAAVGTGLSLSGGTLSNTGDLSGTNELQTISTTGAAGNITLSNGGGTLNLNVNDADASTTNELQTLSWSSPNLSISSGNSVALPVLPAGTSSYTLAYLSGAWTASAFLKTNSSTTTTGNSKRVTINDDIGGETWPLSIHTGTKFLVNGKVQLNSTASTAVTSIMGRNDIQEVGTVTIGPNMELTSGTLNNRQVLGVLARSSGSASFSTSSTPAKLDFNQAMVQTNATANASNDDIVTTITGYGAYEITCDCQFNAGGTTTYNFGIYVNGSLNGSLVKQIPMTSGTTVDVIITGYVSSLATTDEVDIRVSTGSGTSGNIIGRCLLALKGI